ncbi:hypothetical protein Hden_0678 [Hyphomicrobium denitrificans ATCC 51888]|uniref:Uncharacterized protein n=1 Tax=Hyphomicrobium denitrificans (strain ATCC 51888 / DSM 1869 / NCIMB 11706 / TK 0415) TaxID=582899 RepID=D8JT13_HYPDA|nr:hypothetical protein [Hyphomicrobium denitrificans]ADJ22498.1 hypothetical protein Hden_0678 [Hyphomicrobium denitrificans ATCC 51888]
MPQPKQGMPLAVRLLIISAATFLYVYFSLVLLAPRVSPPSSDNAASVTAPNNVNAD